MKNKIIHNLVLTFSVDGERYGELLMLVPDSSLRKVKDRVIESALRESIRQFKSVRNLNRYDQ